jgi:dTDP-4-dehydrorhamnose 3,5-epimerase
MSLSLEVEASGFSVTAAKGSHKLSAPEFRMTLEIRSLVIPDVKLIRAKRHSDARGYFSETYQRADFTAQGLDHDFLQDNQSSSAKPGTIRGLHFQRPPFAQAKLVRVLHGRIFDAVVDLRRFSPTFGKHVAVELSGEDNEQILVPAGFAHGFCTLEPNTVVFYKVDQVYSAAHDSGLNWADPKLGIAWPVAPSEAILSEKDRALRTLADLPDVFEQGGG